jgi:hypothetical protein
VDHIKKRVPWLNTTITGCFMCHGTPTCVNKVLAFFFSILNVRYTCLNGDRERVSNGGVNLIKA